MNYRSKLWEYEEAYPCFQQIFPYVEIFFICRKTRCVHFLQVASAEEKVSLEEIYRRVKGKYAGKVLYSTKRNVISTNHHELQGFLCRRR